MSSLIASQGLLDAAAGAVTCTLSVTDSADAVAATAAVAIAASAAVTDAADTLASVGAASVAASMAAIDAADTASSSAQVVIAGASSTTDAADSLGAAGALEIVASTVVTDAPDTLTASASGGSEITASLLVVDAADVLAANATAQQEVIASGGGGVVRREQRLELRTAALSVTDADDRLIADGRVLAVAVIAEKPAQATQAAQNAPAGFTQLQPRTAEPAPLPKTTQARPALSLSRPVIAQCLPTDAADTLLATATNVVAFIPRPQALTLADDELAAILYLLAA